MEFTDVIEKRYSGKNYSARKVEDEKLAAILNAGPLANHGLRKPLEETVAYLDRSGGSDIHRCGHRAERLLLSVSGAEGKESGLNGARLFSKGAKRGKIEENAKENSHGTDER